MNPNDHLDMRPFYCEKAINGRGFCSFPCQGCMDEHKKRTRPKCDKSTQWVSVKESKPEYGKGVLVHLAGGFTTVAYRKLDDGHPAWQLFGDTEFIVNANDEVTHWMTLPNPPIKY